MRNILLFVLCGFLPPACSAQTKGCTDPLATNYNANATQNDGSCLYAPASVTPYNVHTISDTVSETSGLIWWSDMIWTHNDNTDTHLYGLDTANGNIVATLDVLGSSNTDWEEITQDSNYVYIGDFGNNANGNRTDLRILRFSKSAMAAGTVTPDTIAFSYSDQTNFNPTGANATDFDCEAFIATDDSLYLFTKQWLSKKTSIYAFPKTPGGAPYVAQKRASYDVQGLVTGATYLPGKRAMVLCGYSSSLSPFALLLYDFSGTDFFSGNKRKIDINQGFSQIEGMATTDGKSFFISNEKLSAIPQRLSKIDLSAFLTSYYQTGIEDIAPIVSLSARVENSGSRMVVLLKLKNSGSGHFSVYDSAGKLVAAKEASLRPGENSIHFDEAFVPGIYFIACNVAGKTEALKILVP